MSEDDLVSGDRGAGKITVQMQLSVGEDHSSGKERTDTRMHNVFLLLQFILYDECIMQQALVDWNRRVSVGGRRIVNLEYANDTALIAADEDELA